MFFRVSDLSIFIVLALNWEDLKKKTLRRHAPEGEDAKAIRNILKEYHNIKIPVHEFINLVGPYTSDNGK